MSEICQPLKPPPAPSMTPHELAHGIKLNLKKEIPARVLNAFLIYRKEFVEILKRENERIPQPVISKIVSKMWRQEQKTVKDAYKDVAKEVQKLLRQRHALQQTLVGSSTASANGILTTVEVSSNVGESVITQNPNNPHNLAFGHVAASLATNDALNQISASIVTIKQNQAQLAHNITELKDSIKDSNTSIATVMQIQDEIQQLLRQSHAIQQVLGVSVTASTNEILQTFELPDESVGVITPNLNHPYNFVFGHTSASSDDALEDSIYYIHDADTA